MLRSGLLVVLMMTGAAGGRLQNRQSPQADPPKDQVIEPLYCNKCIFNEEIARYVTFADDGTEVNQDFALSDNCIAACEAGNICLVSTLKEKEGKYLYYSCGFESDICNMNQDDLCENHVVMVETKATDKPAIELPSLIPETDVPDSTAATATGAAAIGFGDGPTDPGTADAGSTRTPANGVVEFGDTDTDAVTPGSQATTVAMSESGPDDDHCPICYNHRVKLPIDCIADSSATKKCINGDKCFVWNLKESVETGIGSGETTDRVYMCTLGATLNDWRRAPGFKDNIEDGPREAGVTKPPSSAMPTTTTPLAVSTGNCPICKMDASPIECQGDPSHTVQCPGTETCWVLKTTGGTVLTYTCNMEIPECSADAGCGSVNVVLGEVTHPQTAEPDTNVVEPTNDASITVEEINNVDDNGNTEAVVGGGTGLVVSGVLVAATLYWSV